MTKTPHRLHLQVWNTLIGSQYLVLTLCSSEYFREQLSILSLSPSTSKLKILAISEGIAVHSEAFLLDHKTSYCFSVVLFYSF